MKKRVLSTLLVLLMILSLDATHSGVDAIANMTSNLAHAEIMDKNQIPSWDTPRDLETDQPLPWPEDPTDSSKPMTPPEGKPQAGKNVSAEGFFYRPSITAGIADTVYFKVNALAPKYNEENAVHKYSFIDTLSEGFTLDESSIKAKIKDFDEATPTITVDTINPNKFTVTFQVHGVENYPADASVEITYQADVNGDAVYDNTNMAEMVWTEFDSGTPENPKEPGEDSEACNYPTPARDTPEDVITSTYLNGFKLYGAETGGTGRTILYIVAGLAILGVIVILIKKRKKSK